MRAKISICMRFVGCPQHVGEITCDTDKVVRSKMKKVVLHSSLGSIISLGSNPKQCLDMSEITYGLGRRKVESVLQGQIQLVPPGYLV